MKSFVNDLFATGLFNIFWKTPTQLTVAFNPFSASGLRFYEASHVKQKYRKFMESQTNGVQQGSHPAITDRTEHNPDEEWFGPDIVGSWKFLNVDPVKHNLAKHQIQEENT